MSTGCRDCVNVKYERDPVRGHYNALKCRAKKEGIPFNITLEDLEIPKTCPVLGIKLLNWGDNDVLDSKDNSPSVDRLFPELGYVRGNIHIISQRANRIKHNASMEEVLKLYEWMKRTTEKMKNSSLINR